ncbi:hypothetical protein [Celeribacter arenosi]
MKTRFLAGLVPALLFNSLPALASGPIAEVFCADRGEIRRKLTVQFGAVQVGSGIRDREATLEIWSNPTTGDWTLVQTYADGKSCILAMGDAWEAAPATAG